ncbi:MAG: hypothetical protein GX219_04210 [Tissierellia bacterium]|nr:hypothetical protein [Tissierellia bacterium]
MWWKSQYYLHRAANLSDEEEKLGKLSGLGVNQYIYDFVLEDGVESMEVNTYRLVDGKWDSISSSKEVFKDSTGRLALGYETIADGVRVAVQSEGNNGISSYVPDYKEDTSYMSGMRKKLNERQEISFNEEFPLVWEIRTSKDVIQGPSSLD